MILSGARAADRAPLAEAYAVTGASAVDREPSDSSSRRLVTVSVNALLLSSSPETGRRTWRTLGPCTSTSAAAKPIASSPTRPDRVR